MPLPAIVCSSKVSKHKSSSQHLSPLANRMCNTTTTSPKKQRDVSVSPHKFTNPIGEGADPWVIRHGSRFLWCKTDGDRAIVVHVSDRLTSMGGGSPHTIWRAPDDGPASHQVWAPELHFLDNSWYVYFTAAHEPHAKGERGHRIFVLKSRTRDPLGEYELHGPLGTGNGNDGFSPNIWAIDMTILELNQKRYAVWSGWDVPSTRQYLYIAEMSSPTKLIGPRTRLCHNQDYAWERIHPDSHGLNEGPQVFQSSKATCILYSCGVSCQVTYKLGMLEYHGGDPLNPNSWYKRSEPAFDGTKNVYGVGHSCLVQSVDDKEWWHVFHAKRDAEFGWRRAIHAQPVLLDERGFPFLGSPVDEGVLLERPSGETLERTELPVGLPFDDGDRLPWHYYGHQQFIEWADDGIHLGRVPENPTNAYRSGEKLVLGALCPNDVTVAATFKVVSDYEGNAGILVRCTAPAVGYHALHGYYVALDPLSTSVFVSKMDGANYTELCRTDTCINVLQSQTLTVHVSGDQMAVYHNGERRLAINDSTYQTGSVGIRVCDTHARFSEFHVTIADFQQQP